jgi:hypothetical protein
VKAVVDVAPGQSWAIRDDRYEGWRYVTVEKVDDGHAHVKPTRGSRRSSIQLKSFRRSRFSFCGHDGPGILPAYTGSVANACGNCPPKSRILPLERSLSVGFGMVTVTRDDAHVWSGSSWTNKRVAHFELKARETPGDWRIRIDGMLSEELYQRQPDGWVLVWRGFGFA